MEKKSEKMIPSKGQIVYDPKLCTGCLTCEIVCSAFKNNGKIRPEISRIKVTMKIFSGEEDNFEPIICYQCDDPKCLLACPVDGAFYICEITGARVINESSCIGCKICIEACSQQFKPPRIIFDIEKKVAIKCDLCDGDPQCVKWCPNGALKYISLSEFRKLGSKHKLDFHESDFGPDFDPSKRSEMTFKKIYSQ
jgi:Fe-S-cluster-containing dehydrogenase component